MVEEERKSRKMTDITFNGEHLVITRGTYCGNGNTALLIETIAGGSYGCATLNIVKLPQDMVAVKDYAENTGILQALVEQQIVSKPKSYIGSGLKVIPVCKIIAPELL